MGSSDIPPASAPRWLIPVSTLCLSAGVGFWILCYVLMTRRALQTRATPMPLLALGLNLSWEMVFAFYVTEMPIELAGFVLWLLFDLPVLYVTVTQARHSFAASPLVARHVGRLLGLVFVAGLAANYVFARWWLAVPHRGHGPKDGKPWFGLEARDTTELAWWSAGVAQLILSVSCVSMLLSRGHSGGQSYAIWFCRFAGTVMGLPVTCGLLWWYWPEPHGFIFHPLSYIIMVPTFACDIAYPFILAHVRRTEEVLPNGMVVAGGGDPTGSKKKQ
ncbi:PaxB protein [Cordyceps javanica]|uniref:PaxB protein n=1 Tax=Cordyceps javanica TaxID=43265 RepID=A0A545V0E0_9HYPO|nr:PaxB protein [Cordyceps javanica]TQW05619.1 PaxB protein [Cordyceps javanica]